MEGYKLVFEENFDYEGAPDPTKWNYETGGHGWGNGESQYYTDRPVNSYVKGGHLFIIGQKEEYEGNSYTSANWKGNSSTRRCRKGYTTISTSAIFPPFPRNSIIPPSFPPTRSSSRSSSCPIRQ